jgi:hypothetical protein
MVETFLRDALLAIFKPTGTRKVPRIPFWVKTRNTFCAGSTGLDACHKQGHQAQWLAVPVPRLTIAEAGA